jgi:hypothetical protein
MDIDQARTFLAIAAHGSFPVLANGGSCFLPARMARSFTQEGRLFRVDAAPEFPHPAAFLLENVSGPFFVAARVEL